jgi:hypothetical protein
MITMVVRDATTAMAPAMRRARKRRQQEHKEDYIQSACHPIKAATQAAARATAVVPPEPAASNSCTETTSKQTANSTLAVSLSRLVVSGVALSKPIKQVLTFWLTVTSMSPSLAIG